MLCVFNLNLIYPQVAEDLPFKVDSERRIFFEKLFMAILFTLMVISFLQRRCHPVTRCIQKIADNPCYNVIFYLRRTEHEY